MLASYIGENFFPSQNAQLNTIETFVVWAGSFAMRPIGGILFAYIGDVYSRKLAVYIALICISCGTGLIGCIPSYDSIGITATILMTILRLIQGLAVGGQFVGTMIYVNEHAPVEERAYYGSINFGATLFGSLFSNLILIVLTLFFDDTKITNYAWRLPFIGGLLFLPLGIWLHNHAPDTTATFDHVELPQSSSPYSSSEEEEEQEDINHGSISINADRINEEKKIDNQGITTIITSSDGFSKNETREVILDNSPSTMINSTDTPTIVEFTQKNNKKKIFLYEVLKHDWGKMIVLASIVGIWSTAYYTMYVWMITYLKDFRIDSPIDDRYNINATWTFILAILVPMVGYFTDKAGVVQTMTFGCILSSLTTIIGFTMLKYANMNENPNDIYLYWFFQAPSTLALAVVAAPLSTFVSALNYKSPFNYTFLAASYNIAQVMFGGVSPIVATALIHTFDGYGPCLWILACNLLGLFGCIYVLFFNKTLYDNVNVGISGKKEVNSIKNQYVSVTDQSI